LAMEFLLALMAGCSFDILLPPYNTSVVKINLQHFGALKPEQVVDSHAGKVSQGAFSGHTA
jgi:hypothetical protein